MEPRDITFRLLEEITNGFSEERKLGSGSLGDVYKGVIGSGENVAVKKLFRAALSNPEELELMNKINHLTRLEHKNIVRYFGYYSEVQKKYVEYNGQLVLSKQMYRALCYEYLHNGSLEKYLSDESCGLDWCTRYRIVKGICEGLKYIHKDLEVPIFHLNLMPANILLDKDMVPKLADFSLIHLRLTRITESAIGTIGYLPPEYIESNVVSKKSDIFSLGVVMIKTLTGPCGYSKFAEMPPEQFVHLVQKNWRDRLQASWSGSAIEAYCQQVKTCIQIALRCVETDRHKRPDILDIIHKLNEMDIGTEIAKSMLLRVHPPQLGFPLLPNTSTTSCLLHLANNTDGSVAFRLLTPEYFSGRLHGVVPSRSRYTLAVNIRCDLLKPQANNEYFFLESCIADDQEIQCGNGNIHNHFFIAKAKGHEVQQVKLKAVYVAPVPSKTTAEASGGLDTKRLSVQPLQLQLPLESGIPIGDSHDILNKMLQDYSSVMPMFLPLNFLKDITSDFCPRQEVGRGGYGVVYKGLLSSGKIIAVKKFTKIPLVGDHKQFTNEITHMGTKHQNVVQLVGYCTESSTELFQLNGEYVEAERQTALLCFEYLSKGSLRDYISDESADLDWGERFEIIKGICCGLSHLHEECDIVHLDLKPDNILMTAAMVPKIADFGLSRLFCAQQSRIITQNCAGSRGYMAPEYLLQGIISRKADIFSLGVIIIEIITGHREYPQSMLPYLQHVDENNCPESTETILEDFTEKVLDRWRKRPGFTLLGKYTLQVKQCITMALRCVDYNMIKRPHASDIIQMLNAHES